MRNKIKLYKKRALVLLFKMFAWWGISGMLLVTVVFFTIIPLFSGVILIDELFGTDFFSPVSSFVSWIISGNVLMSIMAFFGVLGGIYELFYPKSSTRTTTLDKYPWE